MDFVRISVIITYIFCIFNREIQAFSRGRNSGFLPWQKARPGPCNLADFCYNESNRDPRNQQKEYAQ